MSALLAGKVGLVTGAAQGIGLAIARAFVDHGARVALVDLQHDKARVAARRLDPTGECALAVAADVTDQGDVDAMFATATEALGPVDILVNNAGGSTAGRVILDIEDMDDEVWEATLALNVTAMFRCCRAAVPSMRARGFGRIINLSSSLAWGGWGDHLTTVEARLAYVTSKSGVVGFTSQLGKDLAASGICVNAIAPGFVVPEPGSTIRERFDSMTPEQRRRAVARFPIGRPGEVDEVAWLAVALAAPQASYISGETIQVGAAAGGP
jgi:NAD(P)-dependent dehydrogenase (short-subunit alcohol dehydrogenase family)